MSVLECTYYLVSAAASKTFTKVVRKLVLQ
jgi:hypothetical protein